MSKVIFYINIYKFLGSYSLSCPYEKEEKAKESGRATKGYITTVPIEFTEK